MTKTRSSGVIQMPCESSFTTVADRPNELPFAVKYQDGRIGTLTYVEVALGIDGTLAENSNLDGTWPAREGPEHLGPGCPGRRIAYALS